MKTKSIIGLHQGSPEDYRPLDKEEFSLFAQITVQEKSTVPEFMTAAEIEKEFAEHHELEGVVAIFLRRLAAFTPDLKFDIGVIVYMLNACHNPGGAVMWAYALAQLTRQFGPLRISDLMLKTPFGEGLPTEAFLERCWESQKMPMVKFNDNKLDLAQTWAAPEPAA